jgi:hypothetical protein
MLRFLIEYDCKIEERKVFFIHNHDRAWHLRPGSIWAHIALSVSAPTFWTSDFGSVRNALANRFPPVSPRGPWFRNEDIVSWLFQGTSMTEWTGKSWDLPSCANFLAQFRAPVAAPKPGLRQAASEHQ